MKPEHIGIYASDSETLSKWYIDKLGFSVMNTLEKEGRPTIYFLEAEGGVVVEILPTSGDRSDRKLNEPGFSHIGILVDDFDKAVSSLESKGVSVHDARKTSNGWTIGYFEDPEGNSLEIVYRP